MRGLIRSFSYALNGIRRTIGSERNFRIHLTALLYVLFFAQFYDFGRVEYAILLLTFALVLGAELLNTAVEEVVNGEYEGYDMHAKLAKDIAAGGVLVCAITAVLVGVVLFWDIERICFILQWLMQQPWRLPLFAASVVLALLFISGRLRRKESK